MTTKPSPPKRSDPLRDAYDVIRMVTTINVDTRRIDLRDPEDHEFGDMVGDFYETVKRAHEAGRLAPKRRKR